ncbi:MAG: hypothetical protein L0027_17505, partial [Candidatus Rokubacteria bacterium]|nr:hypothetical protein [Candidatus Rokubacteria bacterium]
MMRAGARTRRWGRAVLVLSLLLTAAPPVRGQTFTPQPSAGLTVTFQSERLGGSRVLLFGDVRNTSAQAYERVVLVAEGLDAGGAVVSRARGSVPAAIPGRGSAPFEIRLLAAGSERRYRVTVDSYQVAGRTEPR